MFDGITSFNSHEILAAIILGVPGSMLAALLYEIFASKMPTFKIFGSVKVDGFWIGVVNSRHANNPCPAINMYRIRENRGNLKVYIEHYKKCLDYHISISGVGLFNSPQIAIAYQFDKRRIHQSGTLTARLRNNDGKSELLATFCQYIEKKGSAESSILTFVCEEYILKKIDLPINRKMRAFFGLPYYNSYAYVVADPMVKTLIGSRITQCESLKSENAETEACPTCRKTYTPHVE